MNNNELKHHGVKGMRWGVRRNKQTSGMSDQELKNRVGRLKLEQEYSKLNPTRAEKENAKTKSRLESSANISKDTSSAFKDAANIANVIGRRQGKPSKKIQKEMSEMSDQELRNKINRMNMEQQYAYLNPSKTARGASIARSTLEVAGSVAAIAGSAFGIMLAVKQLKG